MKRFLRIGLTVLLVVAVIATVALCIYICTPTADTDTADIGWKLGAALIPPLCVLAVVWEIIVYSCFLFFLLERTQWNIPLTVFMVLLLLALLAFPFFILA